jgi:SAM-dependent methyltransferase
MRSDPPAFVLLERLATSADIRDRAFAAGALSLRSDGEDREGVALLYGRLRDRARSQHAEVRARLRDGSLDETAFLALIRREPLDTRDHLVEEILDIAYPLLEEATLPTGAISYCPSGVAEVLFMLENSDLGPGSTFVDLGAGLGKVVLLVAFLTGARAFGVEIDPRLVSQARTAAEALGIGNAQFIEGDIRAAPLPAADVYYMYSPLIQPSTVVTHLGAIASERRIQVFSQALDLTRHSWLKSSGVASYWLEKYESTRAAFSRDERPPASRPSAP